MKSRFLLVLAALVAAFAVLHFAFPEREVAFGRDLERSAAGLHEKALDLGPMHVAYLEGGTGEPLLLIHGFGADKDNWTRVSKYLTDRFHVYAIDLPGFGDSSKPADWHYRIQDQVERVHQICDALNLHHVHLGGNSMGGDISATYGAKYPNEVASLWLLDPAGVSTADKSEMMLAVDAGAPIPLLARNPAEFDTLLSWMFVKPPFLPGSYRNVLAARAAANYALHAAILKELLTQSIPLESLLKGLPIPTRIVWGDHDRVLSPSGAKILAGLLPKSSVTLLPNVGHLPMIEQPKATAEDYRTFRSSL